MSLFDSFFTKDGEEIQLKNGPCKMEDYKVGDKVPLDDGVYVGREGVVVVIDGKFAAAFNHLTDKWGDLFDLGSLMGDLPRGLLDDFPKENTWGITR